MIFNTNRKDINNLQLKINESEIVHNFNFLGIKLDENLAWNDHIDIIYPQHILRSIYNALIRIITFSNYISLTEPLFKYFCILHHHHQCASLHCYYYITKPLLV